MDIGFRKIPIVKLRHHGIDINFVKSICNTTQGDIQLRAQQVLELFEGRKSPNILDGNESVIITPQNIRDLYTSCSREIALQVLKARRDLKTVSRETLTFEKAYATIKGKGDKGENLEGSFTLILPFIKKLKNINDHYLGMALMTATRDQSCSFQDIKPLLEKAEEIQPNHLWMALSVATRDQSCSFQDIKHIFKKATKIYLHHLQNSLDIARRDENCAFEDINLILKILESQELKMTNIDLQLILKIAIRDKTCGDVSQDILTLAEKLGLTPDDENMRSIEQLERRSS